jgi:hypothetical protein
MRQNQEAGLVASTPTFEVEGDPDPVGAGAEPFAVQDRLPRLRHGCLLLPLPSLPQLFFSGENPIYPFLPS